MTSAQTDDVVERELRIAASPSTVFSYFVDPEKLKRWQCVEAQIDPRPGGAYRLNITGKAVATGEYLEVVPNTRIVMTWGWEDEAIEVPPGSSRVEFIFTADGDGTIVRLRHSNLPSSRRDNHGEGWTHYMERLGIAAAGGDPGKDSWREE
jgi:uncharacterized protein YndB with AHSA1/START domain